MWATSSRRGSTANTTPLYTMAQSDRIRVFVDVPQDAGVGLEPDTTAQITVGEYPGRVFTGAVARMADSIDPHSRTMQVEVDLPNPDFALVPGMYVTVQFDLKSKALVGIPASALLFRSSGPQVAVVGDDGSVRFRNVTIGRDDGDIVEIASGLSVGDRIALNISSEIADGEKVAATEVDQTSSSSAPLSRSALPGSESKLR
jgi:RND family efflux transporter MFP subunit